MLLDLHGRPFALPAPTDKAEDLMLEALDTTRLDRWENGWTGIGTAADKTKRGHFAPVRRLWDPEIVDMINGSGIAAKGVSKKPEEMFREGYELQCRDLDKSGIEDFVEWAQETWDLDNAFQSATQWGGAFGGVLLIFGLDDGQPPSEPLDESRLRDVTFINAVDRRFAYAQSYYSEVGRPKYGQPETYLISNGVATSSLGRRSQKDLQQNGFATGLVHESRCIRFDGVLADITTQQLLAGWSWSVLQRPFEVMRDFDHIFDSVGYLVSDASQAVFKLRGLINAIGAGQGSALRARVALMEQMRSVFHGIAVDAGDRDGKNAEDFQRVPTSFTGLPDVMDRFMLRLCAELDVPPMEIFGQGGGGLNSAGEAQAAQRKWYDGIRSKQRRELAPKMRRAYHWLTFAKDSPLRNAKAQAARWQFKFHPLQSPTDKELADTRLAQAQADAIYLENGVYTAEEIAIARADAYPSVDVEAREEAINAGKSHEPYPDDEPDAMPGQPGANGAEGQGGGTLPTLAGAQLGLPMSERAGNVLAVPAGAKAAKPAAPPDNQKGDAHDPQRARGGAGRWTEESATAKSREANARSEIATVGGDGAQHLEAAKAHAEAAVAHREMAGRHKDLGNARAAAKHARAASTHDRKAGEHIVAAGTPTASRKG